APGTKSGKWGTANSFTASATDADLPAQTKTYSLGATTCSGFTPTVVASTGVVSWTCNASVQTCTVPVTVTDNGTPNLSDTKTLTIQCTDTAPNFTSSGPTSATESTAYSYTIACADADSDGRTLAKGGADTCAGTVTDSGGGNGTYSFTPTESQGGS